MCTSERCNASRRRGLPKSAYFPVLFLCGTAYLPPTNMRRILLHSISKRLDSTITEFMGELNSDTERSGQSAVIVSLAQQLAKAVDQAIEQNRMSDDLAEEFRRKCCEMVLDRIL